MDKKKKVGYFMALLIGAMLLFQFIRRTSETSILKRRCVQTYGTISSFRYVFKSGNRVTYSFRAGDTIYVEKEEKTIVTDTSFNGYKQRNFPVIYDLENPGTNRILLTKNDYNELNILIPDSLIKVIHE